MVTEKLTRELIWLHSFFSGPPVSLGLFSCAGQVHVKGSSDLRLEVIILAASFLESQGFLEERPREELWGSQCSVCKISISLFLFLKVILFICLFVAMLVRCCTGFLWLWRVGATLQLWYAGFSLWWLFLLPSMGSRAHGL